MADIRLLRTHARRRDGHRRAQRGQRWTPRWPRSGASRSWSRGSRPPRPRRTPARRRRSGKTGKKVSAKNLAVFTRQFSVMIDAGLPLVQCLDILGTQEEDKNFAAVHSADAHRRRVGRLAGRRDAQASEDVRSAVHEHGRGGRSGRYSRHDSQAARDLHRKGRQAAGPGEVGDDLSGRRHRHRRRRRRRHSVEGHSDVRVAVRGPRRRAAAADAHRHRAQRQPGSLLPVPGRSAPAPSRTRFKSYYATEKGRRVVDAIDAEDAGPRQHPAEDRRGAVLPDALDADRLGRADSGRPGDHGQDRRQLDRRGRHHGDAQEHRARRDDFGAAQGDEGVSRRW